MPLFGRIEKLKEQNRLRLQRLRAGQFFNVTCEQGHTTQMSAIDLCRRLDKWGEKVMCPECYEWVKLNGIRDGPPMTEEQKKKQQDEYLIWDQERKRERRRRQEALRQESASLLGGLP